MKRSNILKIYVCGVDWQEELNGFKANDVKMYCSLKVLKQERTCWKECGIVQLNVTLAKWIEPQDLFSHINKKSLTKSNKKSIVKKRRKYAKVSKSI